MLQKVEEEEDNEDTNKQKAISIINIFDGGVDSNDDSWRVSEYLILVFDEPDGRSLNLDINLRKVIDTVLMAP